MNTILEQIRAILETTPLRWAQLVERLPESALRERPAPAEWSAAECLQHIVDTERGVFPVRVAALRAEQDIPAFDPIQEGTQEPAASVAELAATFAQLRAASLQLLAGVTENLFDRSGVHSELGRVTLGQLIHEWAAHDLDHTIQAERALMQPFIRGCGPWQFYFAANTIAPGDAEPTPA